MAFIVMMLLVELSTAQPWRTPDPYYGGDKEYDPYRPSRYIGGGRAVQHWSYYTTTTARAAAKRLWDVIENPSRYRQNSPPRPVFYDPSTGRYYSPPRLNKQQGEAKEQPKEQPKEK